MLRDWGDQSWRGDPVHAEGVQWESCSGVADSLSGKCSGFSSPVRWPTYGLVLCCYDTWPHLYFWMDGMMRNTICRSLGQCAESWNCQFVLVFVCVGRLPPRNHLSRFFGLMERNPRILHLWCRFDNYGNCDQNSVAFRLSSLALLWPNHSLRSHQASRDMYHSGLMFAKLHLVLSKKSFELLGCLKEDVPVCWETALLGVSLMCPLQDAEASLDHQTKSTCCLVSLAKINEPFNFAWSHSGFWSSTFGDQASETLGCNHLVSETLYSTQPSFKK